MERAYRGSGGPLSLRAVAFAVEGNLAYIIGAYGPTLGAPDDGKFTLTLRRDPSGRWLIFSDMDNGNRARPSSLARSKNAPPGKLPSGPTWTSGTQCVRGRGNPQLARCVSLD